MTENIAIRYNKLDCSHPSTGRDGHGSCVVGKKLYVFGGVVQAEDTDNSESNTLLIFDVENMTWSTPEVSGDIPSARFSAAMAAVGSDLYLFGGLSRNTGWLNDVHSFCTKTNTWRKLDASSGTAPSARDKLASAVIGSNIYLFGGFGPKSSSDNTDDDEDDDGSDDEGSAELRRQQKAAQFGWFNDLVIYNTETDSWSQPMHMNIGGPSPRAAHSMVAIGNRLFIFGGRDAEKRQNDLHIYDTRSRKWMKDIEIKGRPPSCRSFHAAVAVDSMVLVVGGRDTRDHHLADAHVFDSETYSWYELSASGTPPCGRGLHSLSKVDQLVVLFGGSAAFDAELMHCTEYYNDTYYIQTADLVEAISQCRQTARQETGVVNGNGASPSKKCRTD